MRAWLSLTILNLVDLLLYMEALRNPEISEVWMMKKVPLEELMMVKLMMPAFVGALLLARPSLVKTVWWLAGLYALVQVWNVLQFAL